MLKTDRSSQFDDVTPWSTEFCRRSRWFWSSASSESKIVVKFLYNDLKWPFPYSIPRNPQIINFNALRLTKNNYNSDSNFFFLNNEMFTLEIHAEYNAATLQKKMHNKIYNSTITLGTPYLDPPWTFSTSAHVAHTIMKIHALIREGNVTIASTCLNLPLRHLEKYISIFMIVGQLEIQVFMQLTVHSNRKNFSSNFSIL